MLATKYYPKPLPGQLQVGHMESSEYYGLGPGAPAPPAGGAPGPAGGPPGAPQLQHGYISAPQHSSGIGLGMQLPPPTMSMAPGAPVAPIHALALPVRGHYAPHGPSGHTGPGGAYEYAYPQYQGYFIPPPPPALATAVPLDQLSSSDQYMHHHRQPVSYTRSYQNGPSTAVTVGQSAHTTQTVAQGQSAPGYQYHHYNPSYSRGGYYQHQQPQLQQHQQHQHQHHQPQLQHLGQSLQRQQHPLAAQTTQTVPQNAKVTGGVSAQLDYAIDEMAGFLSTMACGIMAPSCQPAAFPGYTDFINQVLTATRLPRATIVLALVYLSKRWALGNVPTINPKDRNHCTTMHRMLVMALLLANKFHDDNTFTNKSWYEATGIPVKEITALEASWLCLIKWSLHLNDSDCKGWEKWNHCWYVYSTTRKSSQQHSAAANSVAVGQKVSPTSPVAADQAYYSPLSTASTSSSASSVFSDSATVGVGQSLSTKLTSPSRGSYTIPKWYEHANGHSGHHSGREPRHVASVPSLNRGHNSGPSGHSGHNNPGHSGHSSHAGSGSGSGSSSHSSALVPAYSTNSMPATSTHSESAGPGKFSSYFQQSFASADQCNSYYVSAYNGMATCNCNMCLIDPKKSRAQPHPQYDARRPVAMMNQPAPQPGGWYSSSVAAC